MVNVSESSSSNDLLPTLRERGGKKFKAQTHPNTKGSRTIPPKPAEKRETLKRRHECQDKDLLISSLTLFTP